MLKPHFFETYSHNFRELLTANVAVAELCRCNDHLLALVALLGCATKRRNVAAGRMRVIGQMLFTTDTLDFRYGFVPHKLAQ